LAAGAARSAPADNAALLAQARAFYAAHEIGQKTLDQALHLPVPATEDALTAKAVADLKTLLMAARDVQEGCVRPCASPAEIAVYREKARLVAARLGFDAAGIPKIERRYIPDGKPRLKALGSGADAAGQQFEAAAVTSLLSNSSLPPQTREALNKKALALADALGRSSYIQADGSGVAAIPGGRRVSLDPQRISELNSIPRTQADILRHLAASPPPARMTDDSSGSSGEISPAHSAAVRSCRRVVNGTDPKSPQHPSLAEMCANHPTWAPILAGLLDAAKGQFGTLNGILMNLLFLILGLVISAATGGVGLLLKLAALVAATWAIWKLTASLVSASTRYFRARAGSTERAASLKQIGMLGATLLFMVAIGLAGYGIGKTQLGSAAVKSMEGGLETALYKVGVKALMTKINTIVPKPALASLERALGKAPERGGNSAAENLAKAERPTATGEPPRERTALVKNSAEAVAK
jgi:hypothetical protein